MKPGAFVSGLSPRLERLRAALDLMSEWNPLVRFELPGELKSAANLREGHWGPRKERAKAQRLKVWLACPRLLRGWFKSQRADALVVCLTRVAPRELDDDNAASALKTTRDGLAAALGIDDRNARVTWVVDQRKGRHGAEVAIWRRREAA